MTDKTSQRYECDGCGSSGLVVHDCEIMRFCPVCGDVVEAYDIEESDTDEE